METRWNTLLTVLCVPTTRTELERVRSIQHVSVISRHTSPQLEQNEVFATIDISTPDSPPPESKWYHRRTLRHNTSKHWNRQLQSLPPTTNSGEEEVYRVSLSQRRSLTWLMIDGPSSLTQMLCESSMGCLVNPRSWWKKNERSIASKIMIDRRRGDKPDHRWWHHRREEHASFHLKLTNSKSFLNLDSQNEYEDRVSITRGQRSREHTGWSASVILSLLFSSKWSATPQGADNYLQSLGHGSLSLQYFHPILLNNSQIDPIRTPLKSSLT